MAAALAVACVPVLADNYVWLVHDPASGATLAVDPGEAAPVLAAAAERGWRIGDVWLTHWHPDHAGGVEGVVSGAGGPVAVVAPEAERGRLSAIAPLVGRWVRGGDEAMLGGHAARVIATPGHTAGHVSFHFADDALAFTGDTLFAMGCGRLFEGTPADMFASLRRLDAALADDCRVFAGHEYTQANGRFALAAEPGNAAVAARVAQVDRTRAAGEPTLPTTMALERATNPFLRAGDAGELGRRRAAKDSFAG